MCQPANLISNLSAGIELALYPTHVRRHMFPMQSENVTTRYHTFGGVVSSPFRFGELTVGHLNDGEMMGWSFPRTQPIIFPSFEYPTLNYPERKGDETSL